MSHHSMKAFFSGTDTETLRSEGNESNCFVSLIVSCDGNYQAAVTRKVSTTYKRITSDVSISYEFFGDGTVDTKLPKKEITVTEDYIEYFMLDITREVPDNPLAYLDDRFDTIKKQKQTTSKPAFDLPFTTAHTAWDTAKEEKELPLFPKEKETTSPSEYSVIDDETIHLWVVRMISLCLNINAERFDVKQWIIKHMENVYNKVFPETMELGADASDFTQWADFVVAQAVEYNPIFNEITFDEPDDFCIFQGELATLLSEALSKLPQNPYIEYYRKSLHLYF